MWISGRRAVRPDRSYYRDVRRINLRQSRHQRASVATVIAVAIVAVVCIGIWMVFKH